MKVKKHLIAEVKSDWRRRAITTGERDDLIKSIQASTIRQAIKIVNDHRRNRA